MDDDLKAHLDRMEARIVSLIEGADAERQKLRRDIEELYDAAVKLAMQCKALNKREKDKGQ